MGFEIIPDPIYTRQAPRGGYVGSASTTSTTYVTILSISGRGRLRALWLNSSGTSYSAYARVTIDGTVIAENFIASNGFSEFGLFGSNSGTFDLCFKSSLSIELRTSNATHAVSAQWAYEIE